MQKYTLYKKDLIVLKISTKSFSHVERFLDKAILDIPVNSFYGERFHGMHPLAFSCNTHNDLDLVDIVYIHYRSFDARVNIICVVGISFM